MRSPLKLLILSSFLLYLPLQSMAWGMLGHRVVGEVADSYLNGKTRREIKAILGNESIAMASNWADFIKSDTSYNYLSNWHYANFMDNLDYQLLRTALDKETGTNIYNRIRFLSSELKNKTLESSKKRMYLRLLIHFVGDIHQPMHMGRKEDSGGNGIKIFWFNQPSNLHRLWDSDIIESQQLSYTEYTAAINYPGKTDLNKWLKDDLSVWAFESYQISRDLYSKVKADEKLSYRYTYDNLDLLNDQLLKGGVRLAGLLNDVFKKY